MKIIITSTGPDLNSQIDPRFGRAPWFLLIDSESGQLLEAINNQSGQDAAQGAGIAAAALIAEKGAEKLFTGRLGPKAAAVIERAGIVVQEGQSGPVKNLLASLGCSVEGATQPAPQQTAESQGPAGQPRGGGMGCRGGKGQGKGQGKGLGRCRR